MSLLQNEREDTERKRTINTSKNLALLSKAHRFIFIVYKQTSLILSYWFLLLPEMWAVNIYYLKKQRKNTAGAIIKKYKFTAAQQMFYLPHVYPYN